MSAPQAPAAAGALARGHVRPRRAGADVAAPADPAGFVHLSLPGLRAYRAALVAEESRVSYWRRLISVRLDLVRAGAGQGVSTERLVSLLHERRGPSTRAALVTVQPDDFVPPLPDLAALWATPPSGDPAQDAALARRLASSEAQLSAYRSSLHRRLSAATEELVRRLTAQPSLSLGALPAAAPRDWPAPPPAVPPPTRGRAGLLRAPHRAGTRPVAPPRSVAGATPPVPVPRGRLLRRLSEA